MSQIITTTKQLGQSIKRYRHLKKLTQQNIAENINLGQKSISFLEQGKLGVRLDTLFRVLSELDLEIIVQQKPITQDRDKGVSDEW